jgi:hypothetical protein
MKTGYDLMPEIVAQVKGISNGVVKTQGTVSLRLFTDKHATAP